MVIIESGIIKLMKTYSFRTIIEPDDPSGYHGYVPKLKGVHTCGETIDEVQRNLRQAIKCHIEGLMKDGEPMPTEERSIESIQTFSRQDFTPVYA